MNVSVNQSPAEKSWIITFHNCELFDYSFVHFLVDSLFYTNKRRPQFSFLKFSNEDWLSGTFFIHFTEFSSESRKNSLFESKFFYTLYDLEKYREEVWFDLNLRWQENNEVWKFVFNHFQDNS